MRQHLAYVEDGVGGAHSTDEPDELAVALALGVLAEACLEQDAVAALLADGIQQVVKLLLVLVALRHPEGAYYVTLINVVVLLELAAAVGDVELVHGGAARDTAR